MIKIFLFSDCRRLITISFIVLLLIFKTNLVYSQSSGEPQARGYLELPLSGDLEYTPPIHFVSLNSPSDTMGTGGGGEATDGSGNTITVLSMTRANVGIGAKIPNAKLHVNGDAIILTQLALGHSSAVSGSLPEMKLQIGEAWTFSDMTYGKIMGYNCRFGKTGACVRHLIGTTAAAAAVMMNPDGSLQLCTTPPGTGSITWNYFTMFNDGNVGIGITSNPQAKLDVAGSLRAQSAVVTGALTTQSANVTGTLTTQNATVTGLLSANKLTLNHTTNQDWDDATRIKVNRDLTRALLVTNTSSGTEKEVFKVYGNGIMCAKKIFAEKMEIHTNALNLYWYDHVFEPDYNLRSLSELEQFVKENHHLPEIPSAKEVKENGIELGEMQGKLLLKIEELTLYILDLQKQIDELKER